MAPKKPSQHAADKAAEAKTAAMEARAAVNEKQFNPSQVAAKKKAEGQADAEMDRFFADQEALQDEARQAFRKYDADNSNSIDAEELRAVLADMNFFEGLDETGQTKLVDDTLKEVDANNDKVLSFSEFTTCYNKLKAKTEEQEAASVKLPSIFGEELSASEQLRVKAMPKMLDRGVFAPRKKEAASKDYFDTVAVRDKMFKADWSRIDKKASFVQFKQDVGLANYDSKAGKLKPTPLLKFFKTALRTQYDMLCNAYTYYGCRDIEGAFHAMDYTEYIEFAKSAGFRDTSADSKAPQKFGAMNLYQLFEDLNVEEEAMNKKKQKENDINIDDAFMRFEFLELVMRMAMKFPQTADPKAAFQGFLIFCKNNLNRDAKVAVADRNLFRKDRLYNPDVTSVFFNYQHELRALYAYMIGTDFKDATVEEWLWLCKRAGCVDDHPAENQEQGGKEGGVREVELSLMFAWSQMAMVDELKDRESYTTMSFTEFLEALGRLADAKDLPTKEDLQAHGYKSALEAIADTERAKFPKLQRRASSEFYNVQATRTRGLDQRLLMLFEHIFNMFAPDCGSIALDTYDKSKFLDALAKECEELHGKVLFKV